MSRLTKYFESELNLYPPEYWENEANKLLSREKELKSKAKTKKDFAELVYIQDVLLPHNAEQYTKALKAAK